MEKANKLFLFFLISLLALTSNLVAQYDCNKSYRVIRKQQKKVMDIATQGAKEWLIQYRDTLNLTSTWEQGELLISSWEQTFWEHVDSVLCKRTIKISKDSLFSEMKSANLLVYSITLENESDGEIKLGFNIFGQWTYAEYRPHLRSSDGRRFFWNRTEQ